MEAVALGNATRYEMGDAIATGEFATVFHAHDQELGRAVVLKQIHQQYLANQQQLARYWREIQLFASFRHPNLLTVYDIVRPKGQLILESMRESLEPTIHSQGIDIELLQATLASCLNEHCYLLSLKHI